MVLYGGLAVAATGGSTMHATSPTKAGESHTITTLVMYSCSLPYGTILKIASRSRENVTVIFCNGVTLEKCDFLHSRSKNNEC